MLHEDFTITDEAIFNRKIPSLTIKNEGSIDVEILSKMTEEDLLEVVLFLDKASRDCKIFRNFEVIICKNYKKFFRSVVDNFWKIEARHQDIATLYSGYTSGAAKR
jgi:hypothetical protein